MHSGTETMTGRLFSCADKLKKTQDAEITHCMKHRKHLARKKMTPEFHGDYYN